MATAYYRAIHGALIGTRSTTRDKPYTHAVCRSWTRRDGTTATDWSFHTSLPLASASAKHHPVVAVEPIDAATYRAHIKRERGLDCPKGRLEHQIRLAKRRLRQAQWDASRAGQHILLINLIRTGMTYSDAPNVLPLCGTFGRPGDWNWTDGAYIADERLITAGLAQRAAFITIEKERATIARAEERLRRLA